MNETYTWRAKARRSLERLLAQAIAEDWSPTTFRARIYDAYPFGDRRYHPYAVWCEEVGLLHRAKADGRTLAEQAEHEAAEARRARIRKMADAGKADPRQARMGGL